MFKRIIQALLATFLLILFVFPVFASEKKVAVHFFWGKGCPHCEREQEFLQELEKRNPNVEIQSYEVTGNRGNIMLLQAVGQELSADVSGVPFTVIGRDYFPGYFNDQTTGAEIELLVERALKQGYEDVVGNLIASSKEDIDAKAEAVENNLLPEVLKLPFFGEVKTKSLSLPALTFMIALLDGFNPCAMWVLLFLIGLLIGMEEKGRRWLLGSAFILASGLVYFLFLAAWLNLVLFLGIVGWVRAIIGVVAIVIGIKSLRDWYLKQTGCVVGSDEKRQKTFKQIREIIGKKKIWLALAGIILLAFAVNMVELVCSFGLPAAYTQTLALTKLPTWQYYAYLVFYIVVFMIDDLVVFIVAMVTLQAIGVESKYARAVSLIGGLVMLLIGLGLVFKPELLMFG